MNVLNGSATRAAVVGGGGLLFSSAYLALLPVAPSELDIVCALLLGFSVAAALFLWRSVTSLRPLTLAIVAIVAIAAVLVGQSVPLVKDSYPEIRVTATGQKNPKSHSSEVFVSLISKPVPGLRALEGVGWEKRGEVAVSYQKQPNVLYYRGAWGSGASLKLVKHPYSGIAEISIGGYTQRFDLFDETGSSVDVPLPEAVVSWRGYVQRGFIVVGLALFFSVLVLHLAVASAVWASVFAVALLVGGAALWFVKDRSYAGAMEVVAFSTGSAPARVELNTGYGFTPGLVIPVKGAGGVVTSEFVVQSASKSQLVVQGGRLRAFRDLAVIGTPSYFSGADHGCVVLEESRCIYELEGANQARIWLQDVDDRKTLALPPITSGSERLFLLVEREPGHIKVTASRAYFQLLPWDHFSRSVVALRVVDQDGTYSGELMRLQSDSGGAYPMAEATGSQGGFQVPALDRPDTGAFVGMKVFAILVSVSFVLLLAAAGKVVLVFAECYLEGRPLLVLASVLGCGFWLSIGLAVGWPAIIGWDGFSPYIQFQTGLMTLWYGLGYPMLIGGFLLLGSGSLVTMWSVLATAVLILAAGGLLLRRGAGWGAWLLLLLWCVVLPFTVILVGMATHLRDAMNGLMVAMFAFCGFYAALKWRIWECIQRVLVLVALMLSGMVLALLRVDNVPTLLVLAVGLVAVGGGGFRIRPLCVMAIAAACWIGVGPLVEPLAVPDREQAAKEKRLYASSALINPLTGMLVFGKGRLPDGLYAELHSALDKVMDVDYAIQHWTPYNIVYWHETSAKREEPSKLVNARLLNVYAHAIAADPLLFLRLRVATFGAMLGYEWFDGSTYEPTDTSTHPSFHDHLLNVDPNWQHLLELSGYPPAPHSWPERTRELIDWTGKNASNLPQFIICIVVALRFRRSPLAATVAIGEIVRAGVFFLLAPASVFLYLYDMHLLGFLLPMMALAEESIRASNRTIRGAL